MLSFINHIKLFFTKAPYQPYNAGEASNLLFYVERFHENVKIKQSQCQRMSDTTVRVTIGNEITDYQINYQENEKLSDLDFSKLIPLEKYFGRFTDGKFTGIKYTYGLHLEKIGSRRFVESLLEYRSGQLTGNQVYFDPDGNVIRKVSEWENDLPYLSTKKPA